MTKKINDGIKTECTDVYGESAPSSSTIKYWTAELERGCISIIDEYLPDSPNELITSEKIEKKSIFCDKRSESKSVRDCGRFN